ncbi:MAG: S1C family serine protease [Anaerolineae bacterium]
MEKSTRKTLWIVLGILAVLLFSCGLCAVAGTVGYLTGRSAGARFQYNVPTPHVERMPWGAAPGPELRLPEFAGGALILEVAPGGPAANAGLRVGDIITAVGGTPLVEAGNLADLVAHQQPGDVLPLRIARDGAQRTMEVTVGRDPEDPTRPWVGIRYRDIPRFDGLEERPTPLD